MTDTNQTKISVPKDKKAQIFLIKSKLSTYHDQIWVVVKCVNLIGLNPGTIIPEQDIMNLHGIQNVDVILEDTSSLERTEIS